MDLLLLAGVVCLSLLAQIIFTLIGFGLLVRRPDKRMTADWIAPCLNDSRICRDLAALKDRNADDAPEHNVFHLLKEDQHQQPYAF